MQSFIPILADSPDLDDGPRPKRIRIDRACNRCRQKRAKCDGNMPCSLCVKSQLDTCTYAAPTKRASRKMVQDLENKLKRLTEHIRPSDPPGTDLDAANDVQTSHDVAMGLLHLAGTPRQLGTEHEGAEVAQFLEAASPAERMLGLTASAHPMRQANEVTSPGASSVTELPPNATAMYGVHVATQLPSYVEALELVSWFDEHTQAVFPVVLWDDFMARFHATWPTRDEAIDVSSDPLWFATLTLVLAFSAQIQQVGGGPQQPTDPNLAAHLFAKSQAILASPQFLTLGSTQVLQVLLLTAQYAMSSSQAHLTANTVALSLSVARRLRLDRPESYTGLDLREAEMRRRLWSGCIAVSGLSSAMLGTPTPITQDDVKEDLLPTALPGEDDPGIAVPRVIFVRETVKLFGIKAQVLSRIYETTDSALSASSLSAVLQLDEILDAWILDRPESMKSPLPQEPLWLSLQRNVLTARYLYVKLLLHRQVLFSLCHRNLRREQDDRVSLSISLAAQVAAHAAMAASDLLNHVAIYYQRQLAGAWWHNLSHLYASALALLAALAVSRRHPHLDMLGKICPTNAREALHSAIDILDAISNSSAVPNTLSTAQRTADACAKRLKKLVTALDAPPTRPASPPAIPSTNNSMVAGPDLVNSHGLDDTFFSALLRTDMSNDFALSTADVIGEYDIPSQQSGFDSWSAMDLSLSMSGWSDPMHTLRPGASLSLPW